MARSAARNSGARYGLAPSFCKRRFLASIGEIQRLIETLQPDLVEAHLTWSRLIALFAAWKADVPLRIGFEQGDVEHELLEVPRRKFRGAVIRPSHCGLQ